MIAASHGCGRSMEASGRSCRTDAIGPPPLFVHIHSRHRVSCRHRRASRSATSVTTRASYSPLANIVAPITRRPIPASPALSLTQPAQTSLHRAVPSHATTREDMPVVSLGQIRVTIW